MDTPSGGGRDSRFSMGYNISLLSGETTPEIYSNTVHNRPSTSIASGLTRSSISLSSACSAGMQRGLKRTSSEVCYEQDGRQMGLTGDCGSDIVDDGFTSTPQKGSPPSNGKKTKGRVKIKMEYIDNKLRRYTTFSKRKTGIMKKAYELSTLTGTQVMLLVASETGHVYTFATRKLQPMITSEAGKALIQTCLNSPDPCPSGSGGDQRMSATGFEETELSYNIADEEQKEGSSRPFSPTGSDAGSVADSTSSELPPSPTEFWEPKCELGVASSSNNAGPTRRSSPPSHLPPAPHSPILSPGNSSTSRAGTSSGNGGGTSCTNGAGGTSSSGSASISSQSVTSNSFGTLYSTGQSATTSSASATSTSAATSTSTRPGVVYASPSASLPNGGVLLSVGGGPHYITIPLHLNLPTDLTKSAPK